MRPVQYFSEEYLSLCKNFTTEQIVSFVEDFRSLFGEEANRNKLLEQERIFLELQKTIQPVGNIN
ncbi:MAG: hypothetical protein KBA66_20730 [Leptospiraceae bacterium]|nr:hypothetical protein [Leptospiraceae bacterium]